MGSNCLLDKTGLAPRFSKEWEVALTQNSGCIIGWVQHPSRTIPLFYTIDVDREVVVDHKGALDGTRWV